VEENDDGCKDLRGSDRPAKSRRAFHAYRPVDRDVPRKGAVPVGGSDASGSFVHSGEYRCDDVCELAFLLDEVCAMLYSLRKKVLARGG
jgi:hypothetical protein